MKKLLLSLALLAISYTNAQNIYSYPFDGVTADMLTAGWQKINMSNPEGAGNWLIPTTATTAFVGGGNIGGDTSFVLVNYTSTTGAGVISNWLITPTITVQNGDVVTFYSRKGGDGTGTIYPDNLQFTMSVTGDASVLPSIDENDLGDFTTAAIEINPDLDTTSYPFEWTQYSYTVTGLSGLTAVKFGFRYYVTDGGPSGNNSDIIGVDDFSVDRPLSTESFFKSNLAVSPNPAKDIINITNNGSAILNTAVITDINGRTIKTVNLNGVSSAQINVSDINAGVYFLKITTDQGVGTTKVIKN